MILENTPNAMKHRAHFVAYNRALHKFVNHYRFAVYGRGEYALDFVRSLVACGFTLEEATLEVNERAVECRRVNEGHPPYLPRPSDFPCLWP